MDLPTQAHLKTLRDLLRYRRGERRADVHAAERARQPAGDDAAGVDVGDRKDEASRDQLTALSGREEERDREEMRKVEAALHRLDTGVYGDCADCGEPSPLQRLRVQPTATRCAGCQARVEATAPGR